MHKNTGISHGKGKKGFIKPNTLLSQIMHTTLKNVELSEHFKIKEAAQTCFGLQ